jgi:hypothetical protein
VVDFQDEDLTQKIRLLDIFGIGPLMIYAGVKAEDLPGWVRVALAMIGGTTIVYNGSNYLVVSEKQKERLALEEIIDLEELSEEGKS